LTSLAIYDVVSAIDGAPGYYTNRAAGPEASAEAAIAQAARDVLAYLYPAQQAILEARRCAALDAVTDRVARDVGAALGRDIAGAIIAIRSHDGWQDFADDPGSMATGQWRPTGPMYEPAQLPEWADLAPFALTAPDAFRPDPPPALDSAAYASALEEVRALGRADSVTRTADQTQIAQFWADGAGTVTPPGHWNEIALQIAADQGNSLTANARLFALLNVALVDASIAAWDAKYEFGLWRPETAVEKAAQDGNPMTIAEAG